VIDGIILRDFDYIDLGKIRLPSFTVPLTVKSLLFREEPGAGAKTDRIFASADTAGRDHHHQHSHGHHHHHAHHHAHQHHGHHETHDHHNHGHAEDKSSK
jgi:ethanolamine utilization protein EutA